MKEVAFIQQLGGKHNVLASIIKKVIFLYFEMKIEMENKIFYATKKKSKNTSQPS